MRLVFILTLVLVVLGLVENLLHMRRIAKVPLRILVNGTRGKTTLCRILTSCLNGKGIRTVGRTTGSEAKVLFPDGHEESVRRRGGARITEIIPFFRIAAGEKADAVVVECMALSPENQRMMADKLVRPTHVAITNSYVDHIPEIGRTEEETASVLSMSVPEGARLFVTEDYYPGAEKAEAVDEGLEGDVRIHPSTLSLAYAVAGSLGITRDEVDRAALSIQPDLGLHGEIHGKNGAVFRPDFSINDPTCMKEAIARYDKVTVLFNNRRDREYRLLHMAEALDACKDNVASVYCFGDYPGKCARYLSRESGVRAIPSSTSGIKALIDSSPRGTVFLGLGNIKGSGEELLKEFL